MGRGSDQAISAEEYESWLTPRQAVERLVTEIAYLVAIPSLVERLRSGLARAAANTLIIKYSSDSQRWDYNLMPPDAWEAAWLANPRSRFWQSADFEVATRDRYRGETKWAFYGVRFEPIGVQEMLRAAAPTIRRHGYSDEVLREMDSQIIHDAAMAAAFPPSVVAEPPEKSNRGRKAWPHWEEFWARFAARIVSPEFSALIQARIEEEMTEIAEELPKSPNESTIRLRAERFMVAVRRKAEK